MSEIHDKIKKLLAVAEGQANENESAQAMKFASMLMMRHGIDRSELGEKSVVGEGSMFDIDYKWHKAVASAAGLLYGATPFYNHAFTAFRYVGRSENIDAAQDTLAFMLLQVEALYKHNLPKGMSKSERAEYRRSFKQACAERVYNRCQEIVEEQMRADAAGSPASTSTALVVIAHREQLKVEVEDFLKTAGSIKKKSRAVSVKLNRGHIEGTRAGNDVDLNKKVK